MKLRTQEIRTNLSFLSFFFLVIILLVSSTSPFWHIFYDSNVGEGVFGFKSMRSFLYVFGTHFILFGFSVFMFWVFQLIPSQDILVKKIKRIGNLGISVYCSVSIYYLIYIFIDKSNSPYPDYYYEIGIVFVSLCTTYILYRIFKFMGEVREINTLHRKENEEFMKKGMEFIDMLDKKVL